MILVDTSVWIDHFRHTNNALAKIIESDNLLCHPAVIGELALGSIRNREAVLGFFAEQRTAPIASHDDVMAMVDKHKLFSMGIDSFRRKSVSLNHGQTIAIVRNQSGRSPIFGYEIVAFYSPYSERLAAAVLFESIKKTRSVTVSGVFL